MFKCKFAALLISQHLFAQPPEADEKKRWISNFLKTSPTLTINCILCQFNNYIILQVLYFQRATQDNTGASVPLRIGYEHDFSN